MRLVFVVIVSLIVLSSCDQEAETQTINILPSGNLQVICDEAKNSDGKSAEMVEHAIEAKLKNDDIKKAWDAIKVAQATPRYEMLKVAAQESGTENWECPELLVLWQK